MPAYPGFNTNVRYNSTLYHVQTEVISSETAKNIHTLLFCEGRICYSESVQAEENILFEREMLFSVVEAQHKNVIKKLLTGIVDVKKEEFHGINFIQLYSIPDLVSKTGIHTKFADAVKRLVLNEISNECLLT